VKHNGASNWSAKNKLELCRTVLCLPTERCTRRDSRQELRRTANKSIDVQDLSSSWMTLCPSFCSRAAQCPRKSGRKCHATVEKESARRDPALLHWQAAREASASPPTTPAPTLDQPLARLWHVDPRMMSRWIALKAGLRIAPTVLSGSGTISWTSRTSLER
jgi:hypothetical protein